MFGFFKKKIITAPIERSDPVSVPRKTISKDDFVFALKMYFDAFKKEHQKFFARCAGYVTETRLKPNEFGKLISSEVSFTICPERDHAIKGCMSSMNYQFRNWRAFSQFYDNALDRERLNEVVSRWPDETQENIFEPFKIEAFEYIFEKIQEGKRLDEGSIQAKLDEKWLYLKPLLEKSLRDGVDEYGELSYSNFFNRCDDFVSRFFSEDDLNFYFLNDAWVYVQRIAIARMEREKSNADEIPNCGFEFEYWCAKKIEGQGWVTRVSKATGDQGVDIIACKNNVTVAIQCKRYSTPVGNKAVQEVFAGKSHESCDYACVIATNGFTRSAQEIAAATDVKLIDVSIIDMFDEIYS